MTQHVLLTPRQEAFVREYLVDSNGKAAAIRAGYSANTAESQASRLLRNAKVASAVQAGKAKLVEQTTITKTWLTRELAAEFRETRGKGNAAAVARLGDLLARLHGYIVDHKNVRVITSLRDLSDEELAAVTREVPDSVRH